MLGYENKVVTPSWTLTESILFQRREVCKTTATRYQWREGLQTCSLLDSVPLFFPCLTHFVLVVVCAELSHESSTAVRTAKVERLWGNSCKPLYHLAGDPASCGGTQLSEVSWVPQHAQAQHQHWLCELGTVTTGASRKSICSEAFTNTPEIHWTSSRRISQNSKPLQHLRKAGASFDWL